MGIYQAGESRTSRRAKKNNSRYQLRQVGYTSEEINKILKTK
jgi:hypothetical protein